MGTNYKMRLIVNDGADVPGLRMVTQEDMQVINKIAKDFDAADTVNALNFVDTGKWNWREMLTTICTTVAHGLGIVISSVNERGEHANEFYVTGEGFMYAERFPRPKIDKKLLAAARKSRPGTPW